MYSSITINVSLLRSGYVHNGRDYTCVRAENMWKSYSFCLIFYVNLKCLYEPESNFKKVYIVNKTWIYSEENIISWKTNCLTIIFGLVYQEDRNHTAYASDDNLLWRIVSTDFEVERENSGNIAIIRAVRSLCPPITFLPNVIFLPIGPLHFICTLEIKQPCWDLA